MARIRTHSHKVDFPGAPILPPPIDDNPVPFPLSTTRNRSISTATYLNPHRPAPRPPLPPNDDNNDDDEEEDIKTTTPPPQSPSPTPTRTLPTTSEPKRTSLSTSSTLPAGPRAPPAKSLARQIVALRRMNSEMDTSTSRQSRRYIHGLSREPAPLLPWVGGSEAEDANDSSNDLFDFDFGARDRGVDVGGGAVDYRYDGYQIYDDEADPTSVCMERDLRVDPGPLSRWILRPALADDATWMAELRALALRPDLERLGRWDPVRVRRRFLDGWAPERTAVIRVAGRDAGLVGDVHLDRDS